MPTLQIWLQTLLSLTLKGVALTASDYKKKSKISSIMGCVVDLGSADSRTETFISVGHSDAEVLNVKVREINNFGNNFLLFSLFFC